MIVISDTRAIRAAGNSRHCCGPDKCATSHRGAIAESHITNDLSRQGVRRSFARFLRLLYNCVQSRKSVSVRQERFFVAARDCHKSYDVKERIAWRNNSRAAHPFRPLIFCARARGFTCVLDLRACVRARSVIKGTCQILCSPHSWG